MTKATTITVMKNGSLYAFRVIPLTDIASFIENAGSLKTCADVAKGEKNGWWKVVAY